jgi:hypothetical protein
MNKSFQKVTLAFGAGAFGGLVNSLVLWLFFSANILNQIGVRIRPQEMPAWLYPRIAWGGIWGFLFILPILKSKPIYQALLYSLAPTLVQLLWFFPQEGHDMFGLNLGNLTPVAVLFFNIVWAVSAVMWFRAAGGAGGGDKKK